MKSSFRIRERPNPWQKSVLASIFQRLVKYSTFFWTDSALKHFLERDLYCSQNRLLSTLLDDKYKVYIRYTQLLTQLTVCDDNRRMVLIRRKEAADTYLQIYLFWSLSPVKLDLLVTNAMNTFGANRRILLILSQIFDTRLGWRQFLNSFQRRTSSCLSMLTQKHMCFFFRTRTYFCFRKIKVFYLHRHG